MIESSRAVARAAVLAALGIFAAVPVAAAVPTISGCPIFPADNWWNTPIDTLPLHPSSTAWVGSIGANTGIHPDWGNDLADNYGIPFIVVPSTQPLVPIDFDNPDESDPSPYPIPPNAPIEGGGPGTGDTHVLVLQQGPAANPANCTLYELYIGAPVNGGASWTASSGAKWPLTSNALRPNNWTSADAAGLAILPGLVRWDEIAAGAIEHAIRFTAPNIWGKDAATGAHEHVWPATHWSGNSTNSNLPPMGARFRLRANFDVSGFSATTQVILRAFKKYGLVLADGGSSWYFQGVSDTHFPNSIFSELGNSARIKGSDFEAVDASVIEISPTSGQAIQPVPGAPQNLIATPGNGQATFTFSPPATTGGSPITSFRVTCNPGAVTATAAASPITVPGLANGTFYTCSATASNTQGPGVASASVTVTPATVPDAPQNLVATPGDGLAAFTFSPPVSTGGNAVTSYTLTCNPGALTVSTPASPASLAGLADGTQYTCTVAATNGVGTGAASTAATVTPSAATPFALLGVQSRKAHGAAGIFDVPIDPVPPIAGAISVEPRAIGTGHTVVFQFNGPVTGFDSVAAVDAANAAIGSPVGAFAGNEVTVTLTAVPDNRRVTVSVVNVNGAFNASASLGFLVGDVNNTRSVNSSDISGVKARSGQTTGVGNFRFDLNASGAINSSDISAVKARSGTALP